MTAKDGWEGVDVLIPRRVRRLHEEATRAACLDFGALIEALPTASPPNANPPAALADMDAEGAKAWIVRAIRALPTQARTKAHDGTA